MPFPRDIVVNDGEWMMDVSAMDVSSNSLGASGCNDSYGTISYNDFYGRCRWENNLSTSAHQPRRIHDRPSSYPCRNRSFCSTASQARCQETKSAAAASCHIVGTKDSGTTSSSKVVAPSLPRRRRSFNSVSSQGNTSKQQITKTNEETKEEEEDEELEETISQAIPRTPTHSSIRSNKEEGGVSPVIPKRKRSFIEHPGPARHQRATRTSSSSSRFSSHFAA